MNNIRRFWKTTEFYIRAREYIKGSLMIYPDSWRY